MPCLSEAMATGPKNRPLANSFQAFRLRKQIARPDPPSPSQRVGRRPWSGRPRLPTLRLVLMPVQAIVQGPLVAWSHYRSPAPRRYARHETRGAGLMRSLTRWQSASSPPTRCDRRFLLTSPALAIGAPSARILFSTPGGYSCFEGRPDLIPFKMVAGFPGSNLHTASRLFSPWLIRG